MLQILTNLKSELNGLTKKGLDNKVKADKNKVRSKIFLFFDRTFLNQKRKAGHCLPLSILIIIKSLLLLLPRYPR